MPRYINVEWLMEKIREREYPLDHDPLTTSYGLSTLGIFRILEEAPTVSPDEVRGVGEWIKAHDDTVWWWECSVCHEPPLQRYKYDRLSNYCPNCGAHMEVSEDA